MKIASFDIGSKNFAFCIERFNEENLKKDTDRVWLEGNISYVENANILSEDRHGYTFDKLLAFLENKKYLWTDVHIFLIESQMSSNVKAFKIACQLEAYFKTTYMFKQTIMFPSVYKTKAFSTSETSLGTYSSRKTFTVNIVNKYLLLRKDVCALRYIDSLKKKDDICDAICQLQAYKLICLGR